MKLRSITCIFCICMFVLSSCNDDRDEAIHANRTKANFTAGITTRAVDAVWDVNDAIGLTMLDESGSTIVDNVFNRNYYTSTAAGNFLPSTPSDIIYFPQNGDRVLFKAYYPYLSNLERNLRIPVSVADQSDLPSIDLMTAEHLSGFAKEEPNVSLRFHHRLTKVEFRLSVASGVGLPIEDVDLTIKGMKTTGVYNLFNETLAVNNASTEDILISPGSNRSTRMGIVLPRAAGAGVSFDLTSASGSNFTADMSSDLELKPGYKYIFNITLEGSEVSVSVTIEDWIDGPTTSYNILGVTTPADESVGVYPGDQMQIYAKENNEYRPFRVFTYGEDGRWTTPSPVFWEDVEQNPLDLRASLVLRAPAKNDTQLPDYILADELSVQPYTGANFIFRHVGSRAKVVLRSNVFTQEQLDEAIIVLPSYLTGGTENLGQFTPGTTRGDILVDRTDPDDNYAIIQPQSVSQNGPMVRVTINGRNFTAVSTDGGFLYEAGVAYELIVLVNEGEVSVSAKVIDWVDGPTTTYDVLGVTTPVDASSGVVAGDQMQVYVKENNVFQPFRTFTYGGDGHWTTTNPVFWDNVTTDALDLRAALVPREPAKNETQLPDILIAEEVSVARNSGANFVFNHAGSRVRVVLRSNVFTQEQLNAAPIVLPSYVMGGREEQGVFIPGTTRGNVIVDKTDLTDQFAIIQPQSISPGGPIVKVTVAGREFTAQAADQGFLYEAGVAYEMIVLVNESDVSVSARVVDWIDGGTTTYDILGVTTPVDESTGVTAGDQMQVYIKENNEYQAFRTFTYGADGVWTTPNPVHWETLLSDQVELRAALAVREPAKNSTQLADIIVAEGVTVPRNSGANFVFRHAGSRVKIVVRSTDFTSDQLSNAIITLPSYFMGGREALGEFIPGTTRGDILVDKSNPADQFAIIQPQPVSPGGDLVKITIDGRNFTARATSAGFTFEGGVAYEMIITVNGSDVSVSARVIDWVNGGTTTYDILGVTTPVDESMGVTAGDQMEVYMKENGVYQTFRTFTYGADGVWTTPNPVHWENLLTDPIELRASLAIGEPAKNETQLPDLILAREVSVPRNSGANFVFDHVGSRVKIVLRSNVFTSQQLSDATIVLPSYFRGGRESMGEFIPGTTRGDIIVDKSNPADQFAIIQPQSVSPGGNLVRVTIDGRNFTARATNAGFTYEAGVAYEMIVIVNESDVSVSARVIDWVNGGTTTYDVLGVTTPVDPSVGVNPGDQMQVYMKENNVYGAFRIFTYGADGLWTTPNPVHWETLPSDPIDLRAAMIVREPAKNDTQIPDIIVAQEVSVPRNSGANFVFNHAGSRVKVVLRSNMFTSQQLSAADIVLPSYFMGGQETLGEFIPGTTRGNIIVDKSDPTDQFAIIQPQGISPGGDLVRVTIDGRNFTARATNSGFNYEAGVAYEMIILVNESDVSVSANVIDWVSGGTTTYDVLGVTTPVDESIGVVTGDRMQVYMKENNVYQNFRTFTYGADGIWTTPDPVHWETLAFDPIDLRAALVPREPAKNNTQLADILVAQEVSVPRNSGANFVFNHAGSRVKVVLRSNVFTPQQLSAATIVLPSYFMGGREAMGEFIPGTTRGNIIVDKSNPLDQFAIIQPQSVSPGGDLVRITIGGRNFTARATSAGFTYEAGVSYEMIITVNESDVAVSARVVDWAPSGPHEFSILEVTPSLADTEGVDVGARMNVYINQANQYNIWTTFTYAGTNIWRPDTEVYWEQITGDYADLRASIINQPKLHSSQIDDILIARDLRVPIYNGADFVFNHVGSRAVVALISDTYSDAQLNSATIFMPQYTTGGYEQAGQFVPGQTVQDITVVRDATTNNGIAIIQPQTIAAGNNLFRVRIGSRDYWAKAPDGGFNFAQGVSYAITIHVNEENLTISAQVIDWDETEVDLNAFTIGTTLPGPSSGITDRTQMNVYMAEGTNRDLLSTFTYSQPSDSWTSSPTIYWESIPTPVPAFYASILVAQKLDPTQLDDYLVAAPITPGEGQPVNFTLRHPAAKVIVQLRSSDNTFSPSELAQMVITLPDYITGGEHNNGLFEYPSGNPTGTINVPVINDNATAIIRPQTIISRPVVNVFDPQNGRNYPVTSTTNIEFSAGQATTLNIDMKKTAVGISANAIPWEAGATIPLVAPSIEITGSLNQTSTFFQDKTIYTYKLGSDFRNLVFHYEPNGSGGYEWRGTQTLYWDDQNGAPLTVTGVYYPQQSNIPDLSQTQTTFAWNLPADQTAGYDQYDLLMSNLSLSTPSPVNFNFNHVMSKVRVAIVAPEFTAQELEDMTISLNNFIIDGSASLTTAQATGTNTRKNIIPFVDTPNRDYSALVMPQTIQAGTTVVTITLAGYQNVPFEGKLDGNLIFYPGKENLITVTLRKTAIEISATLEPWTDGPSGSVIIQ